MASEGPEMNIESEKLHEGGVWKLRPTTVHKDLRGTFTELYRENDLAELLGETPHFVQMNLSRSDKYVLRGMHYHSSGNQAKFLRPIIGDIFQVSVDARIGSHTYGQWAGTHLRADKNEAVWVPPGFANGFATFEFGAIVLYQMTDYFKPDLDCAFRYDDPAVNIKWPFGHGAPITISPKDRAAPVLGETVGWEP
jgi:dTDP-4-dehydrorhamnose 3,5-epimerase